MKSQNVFKYWTPGVSRGKETEQARKSRELESDSRRSDRSRRYRTHGDSRSLDKRERHRDSRYSEQHHAGQIGRELCPSGITNINPVASTGVDGCGRGIYPDRHQAIQWRRSLLRASGGKTMRSIVLMACLLFVFLSPVFSFDGINLNYGITADQTNETYSLSYACLNSTFSKLTIFNSASANHTETFTAFCSLGCNSLAGQCVEDEPDLKSSNVLMTVFLIASLVFLLVTFFNPAGFWMAPITLGLSALFWSVFQAMFSVLKYQTVLSKIFLQGSGYIQIGLWAATMLSLFYVVFLLVKAKSEGAL